MKVERTRSSTAVSASGAVRPSARAEGAETVAEPRRVLDTTAIMGVPENELTPKVRQALMALLDEVARLREDLDRSKARIEHLERLADEDSLIPVLNRRAFVRELSRIISYTERYQTPSSVLFFDVNHLKTINDALGHAAGDAALSHVAGILVNNVRESDVVGRLGGDEFGIILVHADSETARVKALELAEKISATEFTWEGKALPIEVAYGVHSFTGGENALSALAAADKQMYEQKKQLGRVRSRG